MCGICGFNWEDKKLLRQMTSALEHRGPDTFGLYTDKKVSIGHRRLSIIDLSDKGNEPMCNEDGTIWLTFNGEIYNFKELRSALIKNGHRFNSDTDAEVIIHAYEEYGNDCVKKFNGQFAFAIWNSKQKVLFLARDRLGIKPLYYYWDDTKFIFASELKAILQAPAVARNVDRHSLNHYLTYGFTPTKQTILKNIYKLQPGFHLTFSKRLVIKRYWDVDFRQTETHSPNYYTTNIKELLEEATKKRLVADVPVGAFLSGGIDSSAIVAMIKKHKDNLKTFSIGFDHDEFNEAPYAKKVSDKFGTDHHEKYFSAKDVQKLIPELAYYYDDPLADYSMLPTYFVSKIARKHVKVCLGGDGGDELFGGYDWHTQFNTLRLQRSLPAFARSAIKLPLNFIRDKHVRDRLQHLISNEKLSDSELYARLRSILNHTDLEKLNVTGTYNAYKPYFKYSKLNNVMHADLKLYLPEQILTKVDRASMAVSLETRVPFLDHDLVEFSAKIPPNIKIHRQIKKHILKKAMVGILPKEIINRKKQGFGVPIKHYFRNELKDFVQSELSEIPYVNQEFVQSILQKHLAGKRDYCHVIWSLLMLKEWTKQWQISCL